jgi:hypothetical protein
MRQRVSQQLLSPHWLTPAEVHGRWQVNRQAVETFVREQVIDGNGLYAYYYRKPDYSLSDTHLQSGAKTCSSGISQVDKALIDKKPATFVEGCLFRLKDVRQFERESRELLHMSDKDLFILRTADYVRAWIRAQPDLKNECIKERLYVRSTIQTKRCIMAHYEGRASDRLRKALDAVGAFSERSTRKGGKRKKDCPWKKTCTNYNCESMDTSRKRLLMLSS